MFSIQVTWERVGLKMVLRPIEGLRDVWLYFSISVTMFTHTVSLSIYLSSCFLLADANLTHTIYRGVYISSLLSVNRERDRATVEQSCNLYLSMRVYITNSFMQNTTMRISYNSLLGVLHYLYELAFFPKHNSSLGSDHVIANG